MPLSLPCRAFVSAGLLLCAWAPDLRAQQAPPVAENVVAADQTQTAAATSTQRQAPTPEERRQQTEEKLRALMVNLGISGAASQDAIIDYLTEDELARSSLRDAEKRLLTGLRRDVPPERMRDLLGDYRAAIEDEKSSRIAAQRKLDARIGYSLDPRLESVLWLMGVLGDGAAKLPTSALIVNAPQTPQTPPPTAPVYGPPFNPNFGARGEIVGTVIAKGIAENGEHWLEIRDDSGASERYAALWRDDLKALDPDMEKQLAQTPLSARLRVQWAWQERRRALKLQPESAVAATEVGR